MNCKTTVKDNNFTTFRRGIPTVLSIMAISGATASNFNESAAGKNVAKLAEIALIYILLEPKDPVRVPRGGKSC